MRPIACVNGVVMHSNFSMGMLRPHSAALVMLQRALDVVLIVLCLLLAASFHNVPFSSLHVTLLSVAVLLFLFFAEIKGIYRSWRTVSVVSELVSVVGVWMAVVGCLVVLGYTTKTSAAYSRVVMTLWSIGVPLALGLLRLVYREILRRARVSGKNTRTLVFAGCTNSTRKMAEHIKQAAWMGLRVQGVFDDRSSERIAPGELSLEGTFQDLVGRSRSGEIDIIYVTLPLHAEQRITQLVDQLSDTTVSVFVVPDVFVLDLFKAKWSSVAGMPVVSVYESPFYGVDGWLKRAEDVVIGSLILVLITPLMLLIGLGVKLTSPGPVLFKQRRYGLKGEVVEVWKFRSMTVCDDGDTIVQAKKHDPRVTPFGSFLRRTSLDELPQFVNVLQGQMSIVGPRPHAVAHNEEYRRLIHGYMLRHKVKPGITGWAQVNGWRGETDTLDKMQGRVDYDLAYVRNWSLSLDVKIIFMTILKGFVSKRAY